MEKASHLEYLDEYVKDIEDKFDKFQKDSKSPIELPTYVWYLRYLKKKDKFIVVRKETLIDWSNKWKAKDAVEVLVSFSNSLASLKNLQEEMLLNWSIAMKYSAVISKLMLNVNHGYKETNVLETKHSGELKVSDAQREKIASRILDKKKT